MSVNIFIIGSAYSNCAKKLCQNFCKLIVVGSLITKRGNVLLNLLFLLSNLYVPLLDPSYICPEDHLVSKTYMTRVEGENTRLRHYLARLKRKTLCYSKSLTMLKYSIRLLLHYLRLNTVPVIL